MSVILGCGYFLLKLRGSATSDGFGITSMIDRRKFSDSGMIGNEGRVVNAYLLAIIRMLQYSFLANRTSMVFSQIQIPDQGVGVLLLCAGDLMEGSVSCRYRGTYCISMHHCKQ